MSDTGSPEYMQRRLDALREFQDVHRAPATEPIETPAAALHSLEQAVASAPAEYADYLSEALACYEGGQYRAAILMTWSAVVQHLYSTAEGHSSAFEAANSSRYGSSNAYRQIQKVDDFLYLRESQFLQLGEDAGMYNRNTRLILTERLKLRNLCGHPTQYKPGHEETLIFIESLVLNVLGSILLNW